MVRLFIFICISSLLFASCGGPKKEDTSGGSPYPSTPLGVSTEIGIPANSPTGSSYTARGTEPFWSVEVTPGKAIFSRPGETEVETETFVTTEDDKGAIRIIKSVKGEFFLNLTKGDCSDGMSEETYDYNATVLKGDLTLTGCANKK